jgi:hypothetical protein
VVVVEVRVQYVADVAGLEAVAGKLWAELLLLHPAGGGRQRRR